MMPFKYNKNIDERCWRRIIKAKKLFGHTFPNKFDISETKIKAAQQKIKYFQKIWQKYDQEILNGLKKIYKYPCPTDLSIFINTSPYSMDGYPARYISVSMMRAGTTQRIISSVSHELSHFLFRQHYTKFCRNLGSTKNEIEEIKEILTVINNIEIAEVLDKGWPVHSNLRKLTTRYWLTKPDIKSVIENLHKILKNSFKKDTQPGGITNDGRSKTSEHTGR